MCKMCKKRSEKLYRTKPCSLVLARRGERFHGRALVGSSVRFMSTNATAVFREQRKRKLTLGERLSVFSDSLAGPSKTEHGWVFACVLLPHHNSHTAFASRFSCGGQKQF